MNEYKIREKCAICNSSDLFTVIDYGYVPLAGFFPKKEQLNNVKKYHLALQYCQECHLMQTNSVISADILFKDYRYMSSISLQEYFKEYARNLVDKFELNKNSRVLEIGSNDGVLLKPLMDLGINCCGFEPSNNISKLAVKKGCNIISDYFNYEAIDKYSLSNFDLITSSNTFAHIDDIHSVVKGIHFSLKSGGHFIFEVHYGKNIIEESQYDNVYHEHIYYYSIHALENLFKLHNMTIVDVEETPLHSGSIKVTVMNDVVPTTDNVILKLLEEKSLGIDNVKYYKNFNKKVSSHKNDLLNLLSNLKENKNKIGAYGASGRANILCNFVGINNELIDYIIDESPERNGRYINNIPILDKDKIDTESDYILIFAWNYSKMIISKLEKENLKFKYIIPFPKIKIIEEYIEVENENTL